MIEPWRRLSPEKRFEGTRPTKLMNSAAVAKRPRLPTPATIASAVSVSTPRRRRTLATSSRQAHPGEPRLAGDESEPAYPPYSILRKVWRNGITGHRNMAMVVGRRYSGATVRLVETGELIHIYREELIRTVAPDPERRYQGMNKRRRRR